MACEPAYEQEIPLSTVSPGSPCDSDGGMKKEPQF
jgi:hypothetical protein